MAKVINELSHFCWVPGVIHTIQSYPLPKVYGVFFFNHQEGLSSRDDLIKIDKSVYQDIVHFIRSINGDKYDQKNNFHLHVFFFIFFSLLFRLSISSEQVATKKTTPVTDDESERSVNTNNKIDKENIKEIVDQFKLQIDSCNYRN